ncbi:MAG TPA: glycosyltransferase [Xanthobacteraceae bacterium]|nr:glycosyltransferase [Xanthobacteraceae bacterium]
MAPHVLCTGGEDHHLRIPFLVALRARGFRVSAAGTGDPTPFADVGIAYHRYHFDRFDTCRPHHATIRQIQQIAHASAPDLVQTFDTKPGLLVPLALRGTRPVVRTINGMGWLFSTANPRTLLLRPLYLALQRLAARWTSAVVFQNGDDKRLFDRLHLLGRCPAVLIAGSGIDIAAFERERVGAKAVHALRRAFGLQAAPVVLTVTRLTKQKGIPTLLRAAGAVHAVRPDVRFLLVGPRESEGPFAVDAAALADHSAYVIAPGPRADVPALLGIADVFAFPTEYREGVPRVLLEAGLAGLPIVTTRMPGCTDIVRDGWNGYCVAPRDARALASRLLALLDDPVTARQMGRRSPEAVRRNFALEAVLDGYERVYARVLSVRSEAASRALAGCDHADRGRATTVEPSP